MIALGPSVSGNTVLMILLSFILAALITATIFLLGKRAGYLDTSTPPVSQKTMRKYRDE